MWTSSYEANSPSEDRHSYLVNMILKNNVQEKDLGYVRMSMWCILDGHGGGDVASYASEALLPHLAVNISRALNTKIISKGDLCVNGNIQDVEFVDFENILRVQHNETSILVGNYLSKRNKRLRTGKRSSDLTKED